MNHREGADDSGVTALRESSRDWSAISPHSAQIRIYTERNRTGGAWRTDMDLSATHFIAIR
jgi:hypothetical protein